MKSLNGKGGLRTPDLTVISRALYQAKPLSRCEPAYFTKFHKYHKIWFFNIYLKIRYLKNFWLLKPQILIE